MIIDVKWTTSDSTEILSPESLVYEYEGEIFANDDDEQICIGKCRAMYVDVARAISEGVDLYELCDAHSGELEEYYSYIFDGEDSLEYEDVNPSSIFSEDLNDLFNGNIVAYNLLILDRVELIPEYRGKNIGLNVVRYMMARFQQGVGVIALNAFPMQFAKGLLNDEEAQWRKKLQLDALSKNKKKAQKKLVNLYRILGFRPLPQSPYMVFNVGDGLPGVPIIACD